MEVIEFISDLLDGSFYASYNLENETEWKIAAFYLPEGYIKEIVNAVGVFGFTRDRASAVSILKKAIKKYPECNLLYEAIITLENENYSTQEEMEIHERKCFELRSEDAPIEFAKPDNIFDIVGERFIPGCMFYDELIAVKGKIDSRRAQHDNIFNKIFNSSNSSEFKNNFNNYCLDLNYETDKEILKMKDGQLNKIYSFLVENPDLYYEGFFSKFALMKKYAYLMNDYFNAKNEEKPDISLIEFLIKQKQIINDDISNFLRVYFTSNNVNSLDKKVLILYSIIFEKQGYKKASMRYLEIANSKL